MSWLLVAVGAALGAPARYLIDQGLRARTGGAFPWGTLVVNVVGSFLIGVVAVLAASGVLPGGVATGLAVGFCGALTTYGTLSWETVLLLEGPTPRRGVLNLAVHLVGGMVALAAGWALASALV